MELVEGGHHQQPVERMKGKTCNDPFCSPDLTSSTQDIPDSNKSAETSGCEYGRVTRVERDAPGCARVTAKGSDTFSSFDFSDVDIVVPVGGGEQFFVRAEDHQEGGSEQRKMEYLFIKRYILVKLLIKFSLIWMVKNCIY